MALGALLCAAAGVSSATPFAAAADGFLLMAAPMLVVGLLSLGLDWVASYTASREGSWDHHKPSTARASRSRQAHQSAAIDFVTKTSKQSRPSWLRLFSARAKPVEESEWPCVPEALQGAATVDVEIDAAPDWHGIARAPARAPGPPVVVVAAPVAPQVLSAHTAPAELEAAPAIVARPPLVVNGPRTILEAYGGHKDPQSLRALTTPANQASRIVAWPPTPPQRPDLSPEGNEAFLDQVMSDVMARLGASSETGSPRQLFAPAPRAMPGTEGPEVELLKTEVPKSPVPALGLLKTAAPTVEEPQIEVPGKEAPKSEPPMTEVLKPGVRQSDTPRAEVPKVAVPPPELLKAELPQTAVPPAQVPEIAVPRTVPLKPKLLKPEVLKSEVLKAEAPRTEVPKAGLPKPDALKTVANHPGELASKLAKVQAPNPVAAAHRAAAPVVWTPRMLQDTDLLRFVALVEKFYQQAGLATQLQAGRSMRGGLVLWLFSRHRPGSPVSIVSCVHGPGTVLPMKDIDLVAEMVRTRELPRGQLVTTAELTPALLQSAAEQRVHLMDTKRLLEQIQQRPPELQLALADRLR